VAAVSDRFLELEEPLVDLPEQVLVCRHPRRARHRGPVSPKPRRAQRAAGRRPRPPRLTTFSLTTAYERKAGRRYLLGGSGGEPRLGRRHAPRRLGAVVRLTDGFDPTGEYPGDAQGIYSSLLVRTLVGYNHVADAAGNKLVPDLAASIPAPTNGGTTYTFHLRKGVEFSPPVNRAVTSEDLLYAMERLARPKDGGQYSFYYGVIKGFDDYGAGKAKSISGIKTPSASTIVFDLTHPTGGFLYRLSMPATGPIPQEVAKCFEGQAGRHGRDLISTAGYMLKGIDQVDISSCSTIKPASGFDGQTILDLVRNPNYAPMHSRSSRRCSTVARSSRTATPTMRWSGSRRRRPPRWA
jgi:hypothetical protein